MLTIIMGKTGSGKSTKAVEFVKGAAAHGANVCGLTKCSMPDCEELDIVAVKECSVKFIFEHILKTVKETPVDVFLLDDVCACCASGCYSAIRDVIAMADILGRTYGIDFIVTTQPLGNDVIPVRLSSTNIINLA